MMFRKIRNRILMLNMAMVSSVVIVAFVLIFMTTYTRNRAENSEKLLRDAPSQHLSVSGAAFMEGGVVVMESGIIRTETAGAVRRVSPDAGLSFSIFVDSGNNIVDIDSMVDLDYEAYAMMAAKALENTDSTEAILVDGRRWQYRVSPVTMIFRDMSGTNLSIISISEEQSHIRFLDVTDSYLMLRSLALTLSGSTLVILVVFFFISRYFADRAIMPMREAWEKQSRFIADASHELRTPLSVINANCGVLYAGSDETVGSQLKWVGNISRAADRMAGLVGNMLSLVSLDDKQLELEKAPFTLSEVVADAVDEIDAAAIEKDLTVIREIEPDVVLDSDREHIQKVLSVLLDNAVKYTDGGGNVSVSLRKENHRAIFSVRNSGGDIPKEDLPRLFDRFYRGDPARSSEAGGYGLGLSIAKAIADQLGAGLTVESIEGEYTEFKFILVP